MARFAPFETLAEVERQHILRTLCLCESNRTQAAKALKVSLRCLRNKLRDYKQQGHEVPEAKPGQYIGLHEHPIHIQPDQT